MRNDAQRAQGGVPRSGKGGGFFSRRTLSSYLRIVSSGASTVASTVRSAGASVASSIAEKETGAGSDQIHWAGFDKLEFENDVLRQVLLLGYRSGFQVWDVEEADDVRQLASRHDGPVSFLQMQRRPLATKKSEDRFADVRPLVAIAGDGSLSVGCNNYDGPCNGDMGSYQELANGNFFPTSVQFYSLKTHAFVHVLKFRSAVYTVRSSPRIVAIAQVNQIHCFDAATLEREYTILTYPTVSGFPGSGSIGYGPLAVGHRWLAYTGSPVVVSNSGRVSPEHLTPATGLLTSPSSGSLVAHYAKESSKQLAAGIVTLGDIGRKKLSKYYSELLPDGSNVRQGNPSLRKNGTINGHLPDAENAGTVIVRDLVSKSVVVQFRAHRSPISALCFDPSGILLVTASVHGHNINVFRVMPPLRGGSLGSDANGSYTHLYRLQRGFTNAIIQDISFSDDSQWIMISSSRGTSHLFAISPSEVAIKLPSNDTGSLNSNNGVDVSARGAARWQTGSCTSKLSQQPGSPITLSVVSRIRNGSNGWKGAVSGAAAAATGRVSPLSGAIASAFHNCNGTGVYQDIDLLRTKYHLLVFSPSGCVIQYVLRHLTGADSVTNVSGLSTPFHESAHDSDDSVVVEAIQKWDICHKQKRRDQGDNIDIYGEHRNGDNAKHFQKAAKKGTSIYPADNGAVAKPNLTAEEKQHLYISEVELNVHASKVPLWAKSEIYFQAMMGDNIKMDAVSLSGGETEVERIPTRTIEARSKDLIPVFDYLQMPRFQQPRANSLCSNQNGQLPHQKYLLSEDGRLSQRSSISSLDCMSEGAGGVELPYGVDFDGLQTSTEVSEPVAGFVNNNDNSSKAEAQLEFVNNACGQNMVAQLECVNNRESLKMMTHFEDDDNEVD
uniref:Breast carcinoma-amplified sequence 3 n=1 Tax=Anthurium amnicola TaxID=1678845 RepID=A0A1D1Z9A3_9ARAE